MSTNPRHIGVGGITVFLMSMLVITSMAPFLGASQNQSSDSLTITYTFPTPLISKVAINSAWYDQILVQDAPCSGQSGEPSLPTKGAYILLPPDTTISAITVSGGSIPLGTGYTILPCGKPIPLIPNAPNIAPSPNATLYASAELFPKNLYNEVGLYHFRGYTILVVQLYPLQYIPASGTVFFYPSLQVTVNLQKTSQENPLFRGMEQDREDLLKKIDNPSVIDTYQMLLKSRALLDQYDLMILTTDALKESFVPLAVQHNKTGTQTIIRTLSDVGGTSPEAIREYIRTAYTTWGISYVLLGGDTDVIPAKMLYVEGMDENVTPYETKMPADLYYACLDGTYNYDGDDKWGEPHDGENGGDVDLIAEVYVGRACASTVEEANTFVQKTVTYLSLPEQETYLGDATFAGEYLGDYGIASFGGTTLDQLINGSTENGYTTVGIPASMYRIDRLYDELYPGFDPDDPWGTGWPSSEIINRINNGVHLINHDGHAYYDYNMRMVTEDVLALTNTNQSCFVYSQGCMSGGFDNPEGDDCIAEYFTTKTVHGAFAGIWNARYGFFWSYSTDGDSQRYHRQFWDAVFGENIRQIGKANHDSKEDNLFMINRSCMRWCYYETNLFGDPAVAVANSSGQQNPLLSISAMKGGKGGVTATIANTGEVPVYDIPWSITIHGGMFGFINISSPGILDFLGVGNTTMVQSQPAFFGFGRVTITMQLKYAETWNGTGFVLGPFLLRLLRIC
jgi:hypothetical protein